MRGRSWLPVSVGLNLLLLLGAIFILWRRPLPEAPLAPIVSAPSRTTNAPSRTQVVVRRENFVWSQIESDDYATFITNLRAIACPEPTIRDIIVAEINQLFARRRATEVVSAEQQWWRSEPDPGVSLAAAEKLRSLDTERRELLARLLGPDWASSIYPFPDIPGDNPLDGPVLGSLSQRARHAVHEIESRSKDRLQAYLASLRDGARPDPAELERLRRQTRSELSLALNPDQLEEYLLRYSEQARSLRGELQGFDATSDEFRALFHARESAEQELSQLQNATDSASVRRRQELEKQRETAISEALGKERYQAYQLNQDPLFRGSRDLIERLGGEPAKILPLYEINHTTALEQQRIRNDTSLTPEERTEALHAVQASRENTLRRLFGLDAYEKYLQTLPQ